MDKAPVTVSFDAGGLRLDTSEDAKVICQAMQGLEVEVLILQGNTFSIEAAERVGLELAQQPNLREAHFKDIFTSRGREEVPEAMKRLLKGISDSGAQLTLLDLSDNAIGPIGAPSVIEFLDSTSSETLEKLYLNNCGLGPEGSTSIAAFIPNLKRLREFICGRNRLENKGATNMSRALSELNGLQVLKVNQNGIGVEGIKKLVGVLEINKDSIREVDLSDNTIKAEGAEALARALTRCTNLKIIRLDDALLENQGFSIICDALSKSPSLTTIEQASFEGNELSGQKVVDLIEITFQRCAYIFTLNLLENEFTPDQLNRLYSLEEKFQILLDDVDSDEEDNEDDDVDDDDENENENGREEGELEGSECSNGYVDIGNDLEFRDITQEFLSAIRATPSDPEKVNVAFIQLISAGNYQAVQILCEELGLMKCEETRKKKPLARDAIVYIGKRKNELPPTFKDFLTATINNNDEMGCGKLLFGM